MNMKQLSEKKGSIVLLALFALAGSLTLSAVGLSRSVTEVGLSNMVTNKGRAFNSAEAVLSTALADAHLTATASNSDVNFLLTDNNGYLLPTPGNFPNSSVQVVNNVGGAETASVDKDFKVYVITTVTNNGIQQRLRALVQLPGGAAPAPKPFTGMITGSQISLSGSAMLGSPTSRAPILVLWGGYKGAAYNPSDDYGLKTVASDTVYVSTVEFLNPNNRPLSDICNNCTNTSIFPTTPPPAPTFITTGVTAPAPISIDPTPYYQKALDQCQAEGFTLADCTSGNTPGSFHHVTQDTTIDGSTLSGTLQGVIYVEAGVNLTIKNSVAIKGTIFHEGSTTKPTQTYWKYVTGGISLASGSYFSVDSLSDVTINGVTEPAFAKGLAIAGGPMLNWSNTARLQAPVPTEPAIKGFVMAGSEAFLIMGSESNIVSDGTIQGGLIGVANMDTNNNALLVNQQPNGNGFGCLGPCSATPWSFRYANVNLGGSAHLDFAPLPVTPPGLPQMGSAGVAKPTLIYWSME